MHDQTFVHRRAFEGMFERRLKPEGGFREALRRVGYDAEDDCERYPAGMWREAIEVARQHVYPDLSPGQARRKLGHLFVEGFSETLVGRVFAAATPLLGPDRVITRLPRFLSSAREDLRMEVEWAGPRCWRIIVNDPHPDADFVCGVFERVLALANCTSEIRVQERSLAGFQLLVRWMAGDQPSPPATSA